MSKDEVIGTFSETYDSLIIAASRAVTRGDREDGDGSWGVRDVLGHVAAWTDEASRRIPLLLAGAPSLDYDADAFNEAAVKSLGGRGLGEVRDGLDRSQARLVTLLDTLDEAAFAPGGAAYEWTTAQTAHMLQHARDLDGAGGILP